MRYKVTWCDVVEYQVFVEADSREEADDKFSAINWETEKSELTGWREMEMDSVMIVEDPTPEA